VVTYHIPRLPLEGRLQAGSGQHNPGDSEMYDYHDRL
jgi:hypothetical protein